MLQMSKLQTIEFKWLLQDNLVFLLQTLNSYQLVVNVILNDLIVLNEHICILEPEALSWNLGLPAAPLCNWQQGSTEPVSCVLSCLPFLRSLNLPSYTRITTLDFFFFCFTPFTYRFLRMSEQYAMLISKNACDWLLIHPEISSLGSCVPLLYRFWHSYFSIRKIRLVDICYSTWKVWFYLNMQTLRLLWSSKFVLLLKRILNPQY